MTTTTPEAAAAAVPSAGVPRRRRRPGTATDWLTIAIVTLVVALLSVMILYPLASIFSQAFSERGWSIVVSTVTSPVNRQVVIDTFVLGILVGAIGTVLGFVAAYIQVMVDFRWKKAFHLVCLLPIVSPPFAVATAIITLLGRRGIITHGVFGLQTSIYGLHGLVLVMVLSFFPVAYMNFKGMLENLDPALEDASSDLGASKWQTFWKVTLPMMIPGFAASFLLLFVEAIADLANPLVIGGDFTVLASRAFIAITGEYDVAAGSAYSLVLLVPALLVFLIQQYWVSRSSAVSVTGKPAGGRRLITTAAGRVPLLVAAVALAVVVIGIYATVILGAFTRILGVNNEMTLDNFRYVLSGIGNKAIVDTTMLAMLATPVAGFLGMLIAWLVVRKVKRGSAWLDFLGMLGLAVPGTVVGIGYAIAFNTPLRFELAGTTFQLLPALGGGAAMLGGAMAIVMVYVIRSIPTGQRSGIAALQQIDPSIDEASASLGADSVTTFRKITMPLIRPAFLTGLIYAFARSMTTLSPIIFITTPQTRIMTQQILAEVDAGRFGNAFAFCTLLLLIVLAVMGLMSLIVRGRGDVRAPVGGGV